MKNLLKFSEYSSGNWEELIPLEELELFMIQKVLFRHHLGPPNRLHEIYMVIVQLNGLN